MSNEGTSASLPGDQGGTQQAAFPAAVHSEALPDSGKEGLWRHIQDNLKKRLGLPRYGIWFKQTELMKLDKSRLVVGVPNIVIKQYLDQEYRVPVQQAAEELLGLRVVVSFDVAPRLFRRMRARQRAEASDETSQGELDTSAAAAHGPQRPEAAASIHSFDRLVITDANRLPYLAAREIACRPNPCFRFLLVLGDYGVGKTALLHAVHRGALECGVANRAACVVAESWCNEYYYALQTKKTKAFRERYRGCDMLLIDGVEFLAGKPAAQGELLHTAKGLLARDARLVLASTVHPRDLAQASPAFRTLLGGAFWVKLVVPPQQERELIARRLAEARGLRAHSEVFRLVAARYSSSIQELNGAMTSLAAYAFLKGCGEIDLQAALEALAQMRRSRRRLPGLRDIQALLLDVFPVTENELQGNSRSRRVVRARQLGMYLARQFTRASLSEIGRFFGGRTHSTVKYSVEKIERQLTEESDIASLVERCAARLRWE